MAGCQYCIEALDPAEDGKCIRDGCSECCSCGRVLKKEKEVGMGDKVDIASVIRHEVETFYCGSCMSRWVLIKYNKSAWEQKEPSTVCIQENSPYCPFCGEERGSNE